MTSKVFDHDRASPYPDGSRGQDLWIGVLGPLEVRRRGLRVDVGGPGPACLLGLLALQPGEVASRDEVVDVLWGTAPPRTHLNQIAVYVRRLRRLLEPGSDRIAGFRLLVRTGGGYRLDIGADSLDVAFFSVVRRRAAAAEAEGRAEAAAGLWLQALECWRGPVLGGTEPRLRQHPVAVRATGWRTEATLAYAMLAERAGPLANAVEHLRRAVMDQPLHEGLHARLLLALAAAGQQAAALDAFEAIRRRLDEELGIEPGEELRAAHVRVLRQQVQATGTRIAVTDATEMASRTTPRSRPSQLPAAAAGFTGRSTALAWLDQLLTDDPAGFVAPLAVISGTAGVGKTTLTVHWAHRVRDRFPDGQLYVDLRGWKTIEPTRPIDALVSLLDGLGVAAEDVPVNVHDAAALYRSSLADRRVLVVLDNARDADQVRPLLPGNSGCATVVTSRDRLGGLRAREGAALLNLEVLTAAEARALLAWMVGEERVQAEEQAAADLARHCAYLPLALRVASANLLDAPRHGIARYVEEFATGDRLAALKIDGDEEAAVRGAFDASYRRLDPSCRRLFRLLGLVPGRDVTVTAVGRLIDTTPAEANLLLKRLTVANLVEQPTVGRYASHDLLREYAAERAANEDDDGDRRAALHRLCDYYLAHARAAAELLHPAMLRLPAPAKPLPPTSFGSDADALTWLDAERANLVAIVAYAARSGPRPVAWRLADALRGYFSSRMHTIDWLVVARAGQDAATADDDTRAMAAASLNYATYHWFRGDHRQATEHQKRFLGLAERAGWTEACAAALSNLGALLAMGGHLASATEQLRRGLTLRQQLGDVDGQGIGLNNLGFVCQQRGLLEQAATYHSQALNLATRLRSRSDEANALRFLGMTYHLRGRLDVAAEHLERSQALCREVGDRTGLVEALATLATVYLDAGHNDRAHDLAGTALTAAPDVGSRSTECIALLAAATCERTSGHTAGALGHSRLALRIARDIGYPYLEQQAMLSLADTLDHQDAPHRAIVPARIALTATRTIGLRVLEGKAHNVIARVLNRLGDHRQAARHADNGLAVHRETNHRLGAAYSHLLLARIHQQQGDAETAAHHRPPGL